MPELKTKPVITSFTAEKFNLRTQLAAHVNKLNSQLFLKENSKLTIL